MSWFQTFPGTSGFYVSRVDTNLLDADTAHLQQSIGLNSSAGGSTITGSPDSTRSVFGASSVEYTSLGAATCSIATDTSTPAVDPSGLSPIGGGGWIYSVTAARECRLRVQYRNGAAFDSWGDEITVQLTQNDWTWVAVAGVSAVPGTADGVRLVFFVQVSGGGNCGVGEVYSNDAQILAVGSVASFVPSLRIVGDLDMRTKIASVDWTTGTQYIFDFGDAVTKGYVLLNSAGTLLLYWNGNAEGHTVSLDADQVIELQVTRDATSGDTEWWIDGVNVESDTGSAGPIIQAIGHDLFVGSIQTGANSWDGNIFWAEIRDGIDGPICAGWYAYDAWTAAT